MALAFVLAGTARAAADTFADLVGPDPEPKLIATGFAIPEGPVWHPKEGGWIMSDISADTMYLIKPDGSRSVYRQPSHWSNGLAFALDGSLIVGEFEAGTVARIDPAGQRTVVVDRYHGKRLNGPDDFTISTDGTVYFTDPDFGCQLPSAPAERAPELPFEGVYHLDLRTKALTLLEAELAQPNGIGLMPGGRELVVSDTGTGEVFLFELNPTGSKVTGRHRIAHFPESSLEKGWVDSLKIDVMGNIYCSAPGGVAIIRPETGVLGLIRVPDHVLNVAFGGPDGLTLLITGGPSGKGSGRVLLLFQNERIWILTTSS